MVRSPAVVGAAPLLLRAACPSYHDHAADASQDAETYPGGGIGAGCEGYETFAPETAA